MTPPISDEDIETAIAAEREHGSKSAAAAVLGWTRSKVQRCFRRAAERGLLGTEPVLPGYYISKETAVYDKDGELVREFIQQKPEKGEEFAVPPGHTIKGVSALVDPAGREIVKWVKTAADKQASTLFTAIEAAISSYSGCVSLPPAPQYTSAETLTVYPIVDLHLGLYAWAAETGASFDLDIASDLLRGSVKNLVARSANSETAIVLDLGDYFHTDSSRNQTERSKNVLDVDTRYARVLQVGYELVVECIELALQKHQFVIYRKLPGNHDEESSKLLAVAIAAHFRNEPRVTVDTNPSRFFMHRFGRVMLAATHGDMLKMGDIAGFMATNWPREWGETEFRYGYTGHVHHDRAKVHNGVKSESFNTLTAKDAWHAGMGFTSPRTAVSITLHRNYGEIDRLTVSLPMLSGLPVAANDNEPMRMAA
jgi:hypothetical protein